MSSTNHARILALLFIIIGASIFAHKVYRYDVPLTANTVENVWDIELFIDFTTRNKPTRVEVFLPSTHDGRAVAREQFYNGAFGLRLMDEDDTLNRKAVWTYRYPDDRKILRYQARIIAETAQSPLPKRLNGAATNPMARITDDLQRQAFLVWSNNLRRQSADDQSLAALVLDQIFGAEKVDEVEALLPALPEPLNRLSLAQSVLGSQKINAQIANGIYLTQATRSSDVMRWLEYRISGKDYRYFVKGSPEQFFAIWYGTADFLVSQGAYEISESISVSPVSVSAEDFAEMTGIASAPVIGWFRFDRLPLTTQLVYAVLVTIPVGITLLVFLRQFIGFQTLGTFMPVLIGIAFRETALLNGLLLFSVLIAIGLMARFYLERLKLLLVPRLAVVLIFIVICMAGISLFLSDNDQSVGLSISLFPMVILTMTIERMSVVWEEYSARDAIQQGVGSLVVASLSYLVMSNALVEYLMYKFPELLLVLLGLCMLMGKYTGLRLSEYIRFRELAKK